MTYTATFPVEPVGKGRPRGRVAFSRKTGKQYVQEYTPAKTAHAEELIRAHVCQSKVFFEAGVPLKLEAEFVFARPKSAPKKRAYPTTRPDLDNCYKTLTDALNGFLFADDSQIVEVAMRKSYGQTPCIKVTLTEVA
jgi:Holliday junction resolvase RusA-like endonuclease